MNGHFEAIESGQSVLHKNVVRPVGIEGIERMENVDAKLALQKTSKIQQLEKMYSRLYYVPGIAFLFVIIFLFAMRLFNFPVSNFYIAILLSINIFVAGNAAMQRTEYLRQIVLFKAN